MFPHEIGGWYEICVSFSRLFEIQECRTAEMGRGRRRNDNPSSILKFKVWKTRTANQLTKNQQSPPIQQLTFKMPKSIIPSMNLLSNFSRSLRCDAPTTMTGCRSICTRPVAAFQKGSPSSKTRVSCLRGVSARLDGRRMNGNQRGYKTVQEQQSRYRSGVCTYSSPSPITTFAPSSLSHSSAPPTLQREIADTEFINSPFHGQQAYSSSPPARA